MRELIFDLSDDSYLPKTGFGGFEGEHLATKLTLVLPERLKVHGAEFYMVFEISKTKETVFSAPLLLVDGAICLDLPKQLMKSPGVSVYGASYQREGTCLVQIAKTGRVALEIKDPETGTLREYSSSGGEVPGLVIEKEIVSGSQNPVASDAIGKKFQEVMKGEITSASVNEKGELILKKADDSTLNAGCVKGEKGEKGTSSDDISLLASAIKETVSGETVRLDDVSSLEHEVKVKLPTEIKGYEPDFESGEIYATDNADNVGDWHQYQEGVYTVKSVSREEEKVEFAEGAYLQDSFFAVRDYFTVGQKVWFDGLISFYRTREKSLPPTTVTLTKYGKNLLKRNALTVTGGELVFDGKRQTFTSTGGGNAAVLLGKYKDFAGKTLTISYDYVDYKSSKGISSFATALYVNNSATTENTILSFAGAKGTKVKRTFTIPEKVGAETLHLRQYYGYLTSEGDYIIIENLQVEIGDTVTEWEDYKEPVTYTPREDGTVEGVTSVCPTTTLMTDTPGVEILAEYNLDTKKYIDRKFAQMQALVLEV